MNGTRVHASLPRQHGFALLTVLAILVITVAVAGGFVWFMNQQQTRSGARLRSIAALAAAEAGMHRALGVLESVAPDGTPGRTWRPTGHTESVRAGGLEGRYTLALSDDPDGAIVISSAGEIAGVTRRLRARVYLGSPAMQAALYGAGLVRLERRPASLTILLYGKSGSALRPWFHAASGRGLSLGTPDVSINDPSAGLALGPGPVDAPGSDDRAGRAAPEPLRVLLARDADLSIGPDHRRVDVQQLRVMGLRFADEITRVETLPSAPEIDRAFFQDLAAANVANAALNDAAGKYHGDDDLVRKRDSLYTVEQFEQVQAYLRSGLAPARFRGAVYVQGPVVLEENQQIEIVDGSLITDGTLRLRPGASLEVIHSAATRTMPGVLVIGEPYQGEPQGALVLPQRARLRVHGLVYARRIIDAFDGARLDIVGAVVAADPEIGFRNLGASVVIRYDPAVLGTPGLRTPVDSPVIAWVAAWEELP